MRLCRLCICVTFVWVALATHAVAEFIVKDGVARGEIVIGDKPERAVKLAAKELQAYVARLAGPTLPIVTAPTSGTAVQVFVGHSVHTDRLKVRGQELHHGGFQIAVGPNWVALVGRDRDFVPREPYMHSANDRDRVLREWDKITGAHWSIELGLGQLFKTYSRELDLWEQDERGSLNAVYAFIRDQGVRWYLPGELGEIVPKKLTIELPAEGRTVKPDFVLRHPYQYGGHFGSRAQEALWQLRMGFDQSPELFGPGYLAHGINNVYARAEAAAAHPEFLGVGAAGKPLAKGHGVPCLSSRGLLEENVRYVRTMFDVYGMPLVSVMPPDGFTAACQCDACRPKLTPERGWNGQFSDYVWQYVNDVAKEVYKTHPDRRIVCLAYTTSMLPPTKIDTLSPNLLVCIARGAMHAAVPGDKPAIDELRKAWLAKMPEGHKQFCNYDYYLSARPLASREFLPVYFPHTIARDLRDTRGSCLGAYVEVYRGGAGLERFGVEALNLYVTGRLWWDADQDVDALLDEYCRDMYGAAAKPMRAFIDYGERNWATMSSSAEQIATTFDLLAAAQRAAVSPESPEGKRIALVAEYVAPLRQTAEQLGKGRPVQGIARARSLDRSGTKVTLDGKLDEPIWNSLSTYGLREVETSKAIKNGTTWRCLWADGALYFGIRCVEQDVAGIVNGAARNDDPALWVGDYVELLLETQTHSYYQIGVSPSGVVFDADRQKGESKAEWSSGAQAAGFVGDGFWSVEVRVPVAGNQQADVDANFGVDGRRPSDAFPWFLNVCRQRVRGEARELSAFSPTGMPSFDDVQKFGVLVGAGRADKWKAKKEE